MSNMSELSAERDTYILANHSKGASGVTYMREKFGKDLTPHRVKYRMLKR